METDVQLLNHQYDFVEDVSTRYMGLVGGYGSGKTLAFCIKAIHLASMNVGFKGCLLEPTNAMVADVLQPTLEEVLHSLNIPFTSKQSPYPQYTLHFADGPCTILLRSAENYKRLAGLNLAFFGVDEADLIDRSLAWKMWRMLQSRLRSGNVYQGFTTSTPEGFNFLYEFFVKEADDDRRMIKAKTMDNPFLPPEFIEDLLSTYPTNLAKAYLNGEFVNLNSGTVYYSFDRSFNNTIVSLNDKKYIKHILHIGQDFNVGKCCSIVHIINNGIPYAVDEINGVKNTEAVIREIERRYPKRHIMMYPDSSGKSEKTNATHTDIRLLQNAFGRENVMFRSKNPYVSDRVGSMNGLLCNAKEERRYFINTAKCPIYTDTLEQQSYTKEGKPDKLHDQDHPNDAAGYFIHFRFPFKGDNIIRTY